MKEELEAKIEENKTFVYLHSQQMRTLGSSRDQARFSDKEETDPSQVPFSVKDETVSSQVRLFEKDGADDDLEKVSQKLFLSIESLKNTQEKENALKKKIQVTEFVKLKNWQNIFLNHEITNLFKRN